MTEHAQRFPPPRGRVKIVNGERTPVMEKPFIECGQRARLGGVLVVCVRDKGHPVAIDGGNLKLSYGHSNGYQQWFFDEPETL